MSEKRNKYVSFPTTKGKHAAVREIARVKTENGTRTNMEDVFNRAIDLVIRENKKLLEGA